MARKSRKYHYFTVAQIPDRPRDSRVSEQRKGQQEEQGQGQQARNQEHG